MNLDSPNPGLVLLLLRICCLFRMLPTICPSGTMLGHMVWNLEHRRMSLSHSDLDGKTMNENTEEAQLRLRRDGDWDGRVGEAGGGGTGDLGNILPL